MIDSSHRQDLLDSFLARWPIEAVAAMRLEDYVDVRNRDTFCQWIETQTRDLGSIKGGTSYKFGIFKRKRKLERPAHAFDDGVYVWTSRYGKDPQEAFEKIKREVLEVINYAMSGVFEKIDKISLSNMFKWKIAFLYSNERLIPIYEIETLQNIGESFGLEPWDATVSSIQRAMMENKPVDRSLYEYMEDLWYEFNSKGIRRQRTRTARTAKGIGQRTRRATTKLDLESQTRTVSRSFMVEKKHNLLQKTLYENLVEEFGPDNVFLEENYVDVKVVQPDSITLYEVKSSPYACLCIREALGQLLFYALLIDDIRKKRLVAVGQYPPNPSEVQLLNKLRRYVKFDLSYEFVSLDGRN